MDHYAAGALNPKDHGRLVADIDRFAHMVGIHPRWISTPLDPSLLGEQECEYFSAFRRHKAAGTVHGLCYVGSSASHDVSPRMFAIAGMMTRQYVDAKVMTLATVLEHLHDRDMPRPECLFIPNFFMSKAQGGGLQTWQIAALYDLLLQRAQLGLQTVLYVASNKLLANEYGQNFLSLILGHYQLAKV